MGAKITDDICEAPDTVRYPESIVVIRVALTYSDSPLLPGTWYNWTF